MMSRLSLLVLTAGLLCVGMPDARAQDQHPILDRVAEHIIAPWPDGWGSYGHGACNSVPRQSEAAARCT
jgi:hypothetical protein